MSLDFRDLPEPPSTGLARGELWRQHAACIGLGPDRFYEDVGGHGETAHQVCARCPVRLDCLQEATLPPTHEVHVYDHGIWGGAQERVRFLLRRHLAASPHPERFYGPEGCRCSYCARLATHERRMVAIAEGRRPEAQDLNGPGATHGLAVTYARGCRCDLCLLVGRARVKAAREAAKAAEGDSAA